MDHTSWRTEQALDWAEALETQFKDIGQLEANMIARNLRFAVDRIEAQDQRIKALERSMAFERNISQTYRSALQEIRDKTPANQHEVWPHHHWYLGKASTAINISANLIEALLETSNE